LGKRCDFKAAGMTFQLIYRQGRVVRAETHATVPRAVAAASILILAEDCCDFRIEDAGAVVMSDEQIVEACLAVTSVLNTGRMPSRARPA
jgi:hypothetical protein